MIVTAGEDDDRKGVEESLSKKSDIMVTMVTKTHCVSCEHLRCEDSIDWLISSSSSSEPSLKSL